MTHLFVKRSVILLNVEVLGIYTHHTQLRLVLNIFIKYVGDIL